VIDVVILSIIRRWHLRDQISLRENRQTPGHLQEHGQALLPIANSASGDRYIR
jgi:hypothetical protein